MVKRGLFVGGSVGIGGIRLNTKFANHRFVADSGRQWHGSGVPGICDGLLFRHSFEIRRFTKRVWCVVFYCEPLSRIS